MRLSTLKKAYFSKFSQLPASHQDLLQQDNPVDSSYKDNGCHSRHPSQAPSVISIVVH